MLHMAILRSPFAHATINSIDTSRATELPGVVAVVTGELLAEHNLAWMPTLSGDTQAVLATDKVRMQGQEVACVIAEDPYVAHDALELIDVDYDPLPVVISPQAALDPTAPLIRDDKEGQTDNKVYHWEAGDPDATEKAFAEADKVVRLVTHYPRCHPAPLECCGCVADVNPATGKATIYMTSQAPHAHRTVFALVAGLPEQNIQIISPDIGGGFGNKVPVYPGYVVATAASLLLGRPVKWIEDRTGNLISTGFARDFYMDGELALTDDGTMTGLRVKMLSDQGYAYADAQPSKFKAGLFHIVTGSYDIPAAHVVTEGAYTNKAPGGVAYRCSFRVTEASFFIERLVQTAAYELGIDPAELRRKNFIPPDKFPYTSATGLRIRLRQLRAGARPGAGAGRLQGAARGAAAGARGGASARDRPRELHRGRRRRPEPTVRHPRDQDVRLRRAARAPHGQGDPEARRQVAGPGPRDDVRADRRARARHPARGRHRPGGRHRQHALRARHLRVSLDADGGRGHLGRRAQGARQGQELAAHLLEAAEDDLEWSDDKFAVKGAPDRAKTIQEIAFAAYTDHPEGMEAGLEATNYYDPPNMTYPFGTYAVVVEVDRGTGQWDVKKVVAVDDCGTRINPMIVEGQIMGGLTEGFGMAAMELITFDEEGNCIGSNFVDYLLPTAWETPPFELGETVTPSPHHPIGAKGVGESATVGSPAAFVNAVVDALAHAGVREIGMPLTPDKVWEALNEAGLAE